MPPPVSSQPIDEHDYPMVGETLGLWRLVRGLGRGGMGEVYEAEYDYVHLLTLRYGEDQRVLVERELRALARDEQARLAGDMLGTPLPPDARFAIKICNARSGTAGHRRFLQEAEVAQRLGDHPYIVTVHAVNAGGLSMPGANLGRFELERGRYRDIAFMVMDLAARDYDHTKLALDEAVQVVRCIATALDHAHAQGVVHRDLKPENLLGSVRHPLLTDFGIAKDVDQSDGLTRTGQIIGTLDYMSPEQATDAKRVDHRSDIYSLGVVLYEMATQGCLPYFHKADRESCLSAIRSERTEPKWPREYVPGFPLGLERIILKAMAFRQEDRYQAMSEFIGDLDRWTRGEWIPFWGRVRTRSWLRFQVRRHPRILWGSSLGAVAALAIAAALTLTPYLDGRRRTLDEQLDALGKVVEHIRSGQIDQPSKEDWKKIADLDLNLRMKNGSYPEQHERRVRLGRELVANRRLVARFTGDQAPRSREQLEVAAGTESPGWVLQDKGLVMQEPTRLLLGPYGAGAIRVALTVRTGEGFRLLVQEAGKQPRHRTLWSIAGGALQTLHREDEKAAQALSAPQPVPDPIDLRIEFVIGAEQLRISSPRAALHRLRGLDPGAQAVLELQLPKDSVLIQLEIRPEAAPAP
jgi:serine/threonine protein kinase